MTRAQYCIVQALKAAVCAADSAFCENGDEKQLTIDQLKEIGEAVAESHSVGQLVNIRMLLTMAADAAHAKRPSKCSITP
jgi:hypothetical protein